MQPAGAGVDHAGKHVDVGAEELAQFPVLEDPGHHLVPGRQLLQDLGIGREPGLGPLHGRQLEFLEEDERQLLGGPDVELRARQPVDLAGERVEPGPEGDGEGPKRLDVDRDPDGLHPGQHVDQRQLDLAVQG